MEYLALMLAFIAIRLYMIETAIKNVKLTVNIHSDNCLVTGVEPKKEG